MAKKLSGAPEPAPNPVGPAGAILGVPVPGAGAVTKKSIQSADCTLNDSVAFDTPVDDPNC